MPGYDDRRGLFAATPIVLPHGVAGRESSTRTREHSTQERLPQSSPTVGPRRLPRPRMQWSPGTRSQSRAGNRAPYKAAATSVLGGAARILPRNADTYYSRISTANSAMICSNEPLRMMITANTLVSASATRGVPSSLTTAAFSVNRPSRPILNNTRGAGDKAF